MDGETRHDRLDRRPAEGRRNSMWTSWNREKSLVTLVYNYLLVVVARLIPSLRLRSFALRRLGATVGDGVGWGLEATADVFFPEHITLEDDCIVGYDTVLLCHEYLQDEYRVGPIVVGERAMVGANVTVLPGVKIGEEAQVAAGSLVTKDVPPGETVAGVPATPVERE